MKALHFIMGKANPNRANGVNQVINGLCKYMSQQGAEIYVLGLSHTQSGKRERFKRDGFDVEVYPSFFGDGIYKRFKTLSKEVDIVHLHGVWNHYNILIGRYMQKNDIPYIITPHCGMADDRLRQSNYFIKLLYHRLFQKQIFDNASAIHALSKEEMYDVFRHVSPNVNIFVIPNGADVNKCKLLYKSKERKLIKIGYLGRLSKEKNIESLIIAISMLPLCIVEKIEVSIAGPESAYANVLKKLCKQLGLEERIIFVGAKYDTYKQLFMTDMDFFVHPAFSEGGSIGLIEIMALGIPLVVTRTSQLAYYYDRTAFIMTEPVPQDIAAGIEQMIEYRNQWEDISIRERILVEQVFNWELSAKQMLTQYFKHSTK